MAKKRSKYLWAKFGLYTFWFCLGAFALVMIALYSAELLGGAEAADPASAQITGGDFRTYMCSVLYYANGFIAALVILMITIAGIIYATSQGGEGVSQAKGMILAAVTGALLYMMSNWLLGSCGQESAGGYLGRLFSHYATLF